MVLLQDTKSMFFALNSFRTVSAKEAFPKMKKESKIEETVPCKELIDNVNI